MTTRTKREIVERITPRTAHDQLVEAAAQRLYDSECALHAARVTGVDEWIAAAADRLHSALAAYLDANATPVGSACGA
jgi:hypothetical protein